MSVVLSHHWLNGMRGGERVLEEFVRFFPQSPIYTLLHRRKKLSPLLAGRPLHQSWLGRIPGAGRFYRQALPLHPAAIRSLRLPKGSRLLVSSDASLIKGIPVPEGCFHLCYCHSPPRYLWEMAETYLQSSSHRGWLHRKGFELFQKKLKQFDHDSARRVDFFAANSGFTRDRIRNFYQCEAEVLYPPVDTDFFQPAPRTKRDKTFLLVSSLVPYKRVDLAVSACTRLDLPLIIIGDGPEKPFLEKIAGPSIRFLGWQSDDVIRAHYRQCRALLFPTLEDFGMVPVEAQACGCPVLAFGAGGALESVVAGQSGLFFSRQETECLVAALKDFMGGACPEDPEACRDSALRFARPLFQKRFSSVLQRLHLGDLRPPAP